MICSWYYATQIVKSRVQCNGRDSVKSERGEVEIGESECAGPNPTRRLRQRRLTASVDTPKKNRAFMKVDLCFFYPTSTPDGNRSTFNVTMAPVPEFETTVPQARHCLISFPRPNVLLVKLNRARDLNCINLEGHTELDEIWSWMDTEPNLICGIITGSGRAFSAGADLKGHSIPCLMFRIPTSRAYNCQNGTRATLPVPGESFLRLALQVCRAELGVSLSSQPSTVSATEAAAKRSSTVIWFSLLAMPPFLFLRSR